MLDVTAFPEALLQGREKTREEESGAKPREGLRRRCRQMARLLQEKLRPHRKMRLRSRTAGTLARGSHR